MNQEKSLPKLASLCQNVIAKNLERYPQDSFCFLAENEWDAIIKLKYKLTDPKIRSVNGGLSGCRTKPMLSDTVIKELEKCNPLLANSKVTDSLVWKDCVNFRFKIGGISRPKVMEYPWGVQVRNVQQIAKDLPLFWKKPEKVGAGGIEAIIVARTKKLKTHIQLLIHLPMSVPLLSQSGIGKALKKFIKQCKRDSNLPAWVPDINGIHDTSNPTYRGKSLLAQMEMLLNGWRTLASASGALACHGRHRNTSEEQHIKDLQSIQECESWRLLFDSLSSREKMNIKTRGAKMRKIRDNLQSDRHKVQSTKTKTSGNRKLGSRLLYGDMQTGVGATSHGTGISKLGKLKQQTVARSATITGRVIAKTSGFGCSVASSASSKRNNGPAFSSVSRKNVFQIGNGKKMGLPISKKRRML